MTDTSPPFQILIVDDESSLLEELNDFLTLHGMVVSTAGDGAQALAVLAADPAVTVVLTDIRMPGLDGLGLANRVLQARGDADAIEVVLMSGHGAIEDAAQAVRAGAFDFLRKPMELDELVAVLTRAHAKALARREAHALRIAERKRGELALKETEGALLQSQIRMRHAAEAAGVTYVQFDLAAQWVRAGENFGNVTGFKPRTPLEGGGFAGARIGLLEHAAESDRSACSAMIDDIFAGGRGKLQFRVIGDDGSERWIEADWRPEPADDGSTARVFATFLDITDAVKSRNELSLAKAAAERASESKSRFLAAASHDLRQPVQSLNLLTAVIKRQVSDRPEVSTAVQLAEASIKSLNEMLSGFLDISRLDAGVIQPVMASVDLGEIVLRLASEYGPRAAADGLALRCRLRDFHARTDAMLLERILRNLIENALRYTARGGVLIGLRQRGDRVRLDVIDTGIGIPADKQAEIFEEFLQLDNPARDASLGLGLGLAIASRLASLLGAELQVSSRVGRGARFSLLLPQERTAPIGASSKPEVDNPGGRILVIEDVATLRMAYEMMLDCSGYEVLSAENGEEALALAARENWRFDAVIADHRLGAGLTGTQTAKEISHRAGRAIPTMIVTGDTGRERLAEVSASGFAMLHKPVDGDELCAKLASMLSGGSSLPPATGKDQET